LNEKCEIKLEINFTAMSSDSLKTLFDNEQRLMKLLRMNNIRLFRTFGGTVIFSAATLFCFKRNIINFWGDRTSEVITTQKVQDETTNLTTSIIHKEDVKNAVADNLAYAIGTDIVRKEAEKLVLDILSDPRFQKQAGEQVWKITKEAYLPTFFRGTEYPLRGQGLSPLRD